MRHCGVTGIVENIKIKKKQVLFKKKKQRSNTQVVGKAREVALVMGWFKMYFRTQPIIVLLCGTTKAVVKSTCPTRFFFFDEC